MRLMRLFIVMCVVATAGIAAAQDPIPISDLHQNDDMGYPSLIEQIVTIQGIVTVPTGVFEASRTDVYIQDSTGGVNLFSFNPIATYNAGDEVKITGTVLFFNGLTEVEPITAEVISTGNPIPDPLLLTCAEVRDSYDFATNREPNEGRLIRINNVTWDPVSLALTDDTGTAMMYIDYTTGIDPDDIEGEFNVVGILKQYDDAGEEGPWYLGYEIQPRYVSDITYGSGPQFVDFPVQTDVAMGGATIEWTTDSDCETILEYGTTTSFELGSIEFGDSTSNHVAVLTGLDSATVYYVRAVATDGSNTVTSPAITIIAPSELSSGDIDVYFSQSVDTSYSTGVAATQTNIADRMIEHIDAATTSIDFCFYAFTRDDVAEALINAHDRGVDVRVIYEIFDPVINVLIVAGIPVVTDPDADHENTHNKFAVFDAQDADETNDYVWTGSWNASYSATNLNAENAVVVQDAALAKTYTIEFDEMWGGTFSSYKSENTPHRFLIGGRKVEQYMSPTDNLQGHMTDLIGTADSDLFFAIYTFTDTVISDAIIDRIDAGVAVRGVMDDDNEVYEYSVYQPLLDAGADVVIDNVEQGSPDDQILHHKYLMTDPLPGGSDPSVVTGSYNWTYTAATYKDENILIIHDATIANIFFQEWMARYKEAGGTWDIEIEQDLQAAFDWSPQVPAINQAVTFTDTSTGDVTGWSWDFGDGAGTSTDQNPTYTYTEAGTYLVNLEVTDGSDTSSVSHEITVTEATACTPIYIAAAASGAGAGTSQWATDLGITNSGSDTLVYAFQFLPRGADNTGADMTDPITLGANSSANYVDIWQTYMGDGAGSITVCVSDPEAAGVVSRTYNTSAAGTFGQTIVGIEGTAPAKLIGSGEKVRLGFLSENDAFRTNIGFMNAGAGTITIKGEFFTADGTSLGNRTINILPYSNNQWNGAFNPVSTGDVDLGYVDVWSDSADASFLTYASVVDNGTDDPTTIWPFDTSQAVGGGSFSGCTPVWVAAAASADGAGDTVWATDLNLTNMGSDSLMYWFQLLPRGADNSGVAMSDPFTLAGNQAVAYSDIWSSLSGSQGAGAINVCVDDADNAGIVTRTYNTGPDGTFGQTIVGMRGAAPAKVSTGDKVRLGFLFENDAYRTNIGFANAGPNTVTVNVEFFDSDGTSLGTKGVNLKPYSNTQWNQAYTLNPINATGIEAGFADVWTDTADSDFLTYASIVDNSTGDPTTIWPF